MKIIECNENQFINDFFPLIVDLWYSDKYDPNNNQHVEWVMRKIHATFNDFSVALCAYTDENEPIGFFWYKHDTCLEGVSFEGKVAHIISCGLYERFRGQGIGTLLLEKVCNKIKSDGGECLYTDTYAANSDAIMFLSSVNLFLLLYCPD